MGSTHGRLILLRLLHLPITLYFLLGGRFLIRSANNFIISYKAQPFFKKSYYWVNFNLLSNDINFHGSSIRKKALLLIEVKHPLIKYHYFIILECLRHFCILKYLQADILKPYKSPLKLIIESLLPFHFSI